MKTFNFLLAYYKSIEQIKFFSSKDIFPNSLPFLYAIHHCLINIINFFCVFSYLNLAIVCCVIYCLKSCIIQVQCIQQQSQVFQHISQFKLCFITQVSNCFLGFQQFPRTYQCIFNFLSLSFLAHLSFILISTGFHVQFQCCQVQLTIELNLKSSVPYSSHESFKYLVCVMFQG